MKLQIFTFAITCLAAGHALAGAGLTNAGVDAGSPNQPNDPTLAQVAPVPGNAVPTATAPGATIAATANPATVANATGSAPTRAPVAATMVVTPPPPPDPATLPVSVIRPVGKAASATTPPNPTATSNVTTTAMPSASSARSSAPPASAAGETAAAPSAPMATARRPASGAANRPDLAAARVKAETPADDTAVSGSGGVIFYSGLGIAGAIVLLSAAAFLRGRGD